MTTIEKKNQAATSAIYGIIYGGKAFEYGGKILTRENLDGYIKVTRSKSGIYRFILCVKGESYAFAQVELADGEIVVRESPFCLIKNSTWNEAAHDFNADYDSNGSPYFAQYAEL